MQISFKTGNLAALSKKTALATLLGYGIALSAIWLLPATSMGFQAQPRSETNLDSRFVLLKNGQLIEGVVSKSETETVLQIPGGSRLILRNAEVDTICNSIKEAYWQKAARTKASDLQGQIKLYRWCLSQNLLQQAQNQIDIISMMKIEPTELEYLHRQLLVAIDAQKTTTPEKQLEPTLPQTQVAETKKGTGGTDAFRQNQFRPLPDLDETPTQQTGGKVALVGFNQPLDSVNPRPATELELVGAKKQVATIKELEALTKSIPKPAVAMFKRKIEPLLARGCYANGCHKSDAEVMPLNRLAKGQLIPRRLSQRNLHSILQHTDPQEPLYSPLLSAATTAHGGSEQPVIKANSKQFINIANWLIMISNQPNAVHQLPPEYLQNTPDDATSLPEPPRDEATSEVVEFKEDKEDMEAFKPRDPEEFNRRFRQHDDKDRP